MSLSLSPFSLSGLSLALPVGLVPLAVEATAVPLPQRAKVTPVAQAAVLHLNEDANAPSPGPLPIPDQGPTPVPDATGGTLDQGAVRTLLTGRRDITEAEIEADLRCLTGGGTRETE